MEITTDQANEAILCKSCSVHVEPNDQFCNHCGYPLKGTEKEQKDFIMDRSTKEIYLADANTKIKRASYALYFIAGATVLTGLIQYATAKDSTLLLVNVILAVIYTALGFWCRSKPLAAIVSGASLYALIFILNAIVSPLTIISGIIIKIFIIASFIRGIKSAIEAEKLKKDLNIG